MAKSPPGSKTLDLAELLSQATTFHRRGELADAERCYRQLLNAKRDHAEARHFLGILRFQQGRTQEALGLIAAAIELKQDYAEAFYNRGNILAAMARYEQALSDYDRALSLQPGNIEAQYNRGNALFKLCRYQEALVSYNQVLAVHPAHVETLIIRGATLQELRRYDEALASYDRVRELAPRHAAVHYGLGNLFSEIKRFDEALTSYGAALAISTDHPDRFGIVVPAMATCDWARTEALAAPLHDALMAGKPSVNPFTLVGYSDDPALHLQCARNFVADRLPSRPEPMCKGPVARRHDRIRLAYLSADFHKHATAYLMAELFEVHDRTQFEVLGVSFGIDDGSAIRERLVRSFDAFHDVRASSDRDIASRLRALDVDIAIDLKGHTRNSRLAVLAYRPAPIQVGYLGYPGTIGADFLDYIIADPIVLPLDQHAFFSEKVVQLPGSYQVNDRKRAIAADTPTREAAHLPANGFVFCSFNNHFKITGPVFDTWMRLLQAVPGSVLWLIRGSAEAALRREARARGIDPARLIFAESCSLAAHLARHRLADLFLDTVPCNAHTTASDALWAGLPLVTCQGQAFPGRVAASLLHAVGMPELITYNLPDYEALALTLATDAGRLAAAREKLARNRLSTPLFDTDRFAHSLEAAYRRMCDISQHGEPAQSFRVEADGSYGACC